MFPACLIFGPSNNKDMTTKHTPGPWSVYDMGHIGTVAVAHTDNSGVKHLVVGPVLQNVANARLIAAAPELLAFAEMIANGGIEAATISEIESEACALIAKAIGTNQ